MAFIKNFLSARPITLPSSRIVLSLFHPVLLAVFPVLSLYLQNVNDLPVQTIIRPSIIGIGLSLVLFAIFYIFWRNAIRAALAASLLLIITFSYGHLYEGLKSVGLSGETLVRHRYLLPIVATGTLVLLISIKKLNTPQLWGQSAGAVALSLIAISLVANFSTLLDRVSSAPIMVDENSECMLKKSNIENLPDVYIIIMDAYTRADILADLHGFNNGPFIQALEDRGFYIPEASLSNYRFTVLSLASMLNLDYVQSFPDRYNPQSQSRWGIAQMISDNVVRHELECIGYRTATVDSGVYWTDWSDADYYLSAEGDPLASGTILPRATRFETLLLETSIARAYLDIFRQLNPAAIPESLDQSLQHKERVLGQLDQIPTLIKFPSPKLVYVHIVSPHPPFVFGSDEQTGEFGRFEEEFAAVGGDGTSLKRYAETVEYLNGRLIKIVDELLNDSVNDPVIVITGDHGWAERNAEDKLSIFQAYHFPSDDYSRLYPTISAVNSFRVVFDTEFGASLGTLPDVSYYSVLGDIWNFQVIENSWNSTGNQ